jgi:hypothetical protein
VANARPWGSTDLDEDWTDPDPHRHCTGEVCGHELAGRSWAQTLAALDGVAGDSIYLRADLEAEAMWDDFREVDE